MSVIEMYMDPGTFSLSLRLDTPHLMETVVEFGHIVILAQYPGDPRGFTDSGLLDAARYAGVVLEPEWRNGIMSVYGAGMDWHLGADGVGPRLESVFSFSADALDAVLDSAANNGLLPAAIVQGSVESTGSYTGSHEDQLCKDAITAVMRTLEAHYRINPDGTIDAEAVGTGSVFVEKPSVIAVRRNWGSDALWTGVPSEELVSRRKARGYMTRLLVGSEGSNTGYSRSSVSYSDIHGNTLVRTGLDSGAGVDSGAEDDYAAGVLADHDVITEEQIRLDQYQIVPVAGTSGTVKPGDMIYVWDPASGFYDDDNGPIWFRGEAIAPLALRVAESEWPLVRGMGVYYRPSGSSIDTGDWVDLTPYMAWEGDGGMLVRALAGTAVVVPPE